MKKKKVIRNLLAALSVLPLTMAMTPCEVNAGPMSNNNSMPVWIKSTDGTNYVGKKKKITHWDNEEPFLHTEGVLSDKTIHMIVENNVNLQAAGSHPTVAFNTKTNGFELSYWTRVENVDLKFEAGKNLNIIGRASDQMGDGAVLFSGKNNTMSFTAENTSIQNTSSRGNSHYVIAGYNTQSTDGGKKRHALRRHE